MFTLVSSSDEKSKLSISLKRDDIRAVLFALMVTQIKWRQFLKLFLNFKLKVNLMTLGGICLQVISAFHHNLMLFS